MGGLSSGRPLSKTYTPALRWPWATDTLLKSSYNFMVSLRCHLTEIHTTTCNFKLSHSHIHHAIPQHPSPPSLCHQSHHELTGTEYRRDGLTTWFWAQIDTSPLEMEAMMGLTGCHCAHTHNVHIHIKEHELLSTNKLKKTIVTDCATL